mgnify:CR=1 FL=1
MKKISLILATIIIAFSSCDKLEEPYVPFDGGYNTELYGDPPVFTVPETTEKNVLVEDFTAHQCGNCPDAAVLAEELMENNPGRVCPVAIHAGTLAATNDEYPTDWTTEEGDVFWAQINGFLNPVGRVNRYDTPSDYYSPTEWADLVLTEMQTETTVELQMQVEWKPEYGHVNIHVHGHYFSDQVGGEHKLSILILESHIISDQLYYIDGNPNDAVHIYDYEFNHILRGSVTGALGLPVITDPVDGDHFQSDFSYLWNNDWVVENSQVIAIVSDENGYVLNCLGQYITN